MEKINSVLSRFDAWQRRYRLTGFIFAVFKKYSEDQAGYLAALLTYYTFLAIFPLLLVLATVTELLTNKYPHAQATIIKGTTNYFPVLGDQLSSHVHGLHKNGLALFLGLLLTFYGARGIADVFRKAVNDIWYIPRKERPGFPGSLLHSFSIIGVGGAGFIMASVVAGLASSVGHGIGFRLLWSALGIFILFWLFSFLLNMSLPSHISLRQLRSAALSAAVGLVVLQLVGSYILSRELRHLDAVYSYFAIALGLMFWIYLQAQIVCYAVEIACVRSRRLYPRSFQGRPTSADKATSTLRQGQLVE